MALIKCKHCGNLISDKAIRCPKCNQINDNIKEQGKVIQDSHKKANDYLHKYRQHLHNL